MRVDTKKRTVSLPKSADMMMVDEAKQALLDMHGRSDRRATIDLSATEEIDTSIFQLVAACNRSFSDLKLTGMDGKPFADRLANLLASDA
ncbi:MAG: hypothetical protein Q9M13_05365 [Mariprofundales bacterium]|nr:hypothetical protein [Mariprofundales bacterium]